MHTDVVEGVDPTEDAVGRTSARLLAAGVDRGARLDALHLLAILDASADVGGRVRRPLDDLADEFGLDHGSVMRSLDHLVAVDAVVRDGPAVLLPRHGAHAVGGLLLADFLDDVRGALEDDSSVSRRRSQLLTRVSVGLVAAAAVAAVALIAPGSAGGGTTPIAATPTTDSGATITAVADAPTGAGGRPVTPDSNRPDRPSAPVAGSTGRSTTPTRPEPVTTTPAAACPTGAPTAAVTSAEGDIDETASTVGTSPTISGTATNPAERAIVITEMSVRAGATRGHLVEPLAIGPGETVTWSVPVDGVGVPEGDEADIEAWEWADPAIAASCPS